MSMAKMSAGSIVTSADMRICDRLHLSVLCLYHLTAHENIEMPLLLNGHKPTERRGSCCKLSISDRAHHRPISSAAVNNSVAVAGLAQTPIGG
jgi:predicted ABC-type transport system involved in lysophospholipase L1 biosynthesis ATPase subunit